MEQQQQQVEQRDKAFLEYCSLADQYMELMCQLNDAMREGFMSLAKAQYTVGRDALSPTWFDMKMSALRTVELAAPPGADTAHAATVTAHCRKPESRRQDPLYWYGALPCAALRSAQSAFCRAADLTAQLAQLRMGMAAEAASVLEQDGGAPAQ